MQKKLPEGTPVGCKDDCVNCTISGRGKIETDKNTGRQHCVCPKFGPIIIPEVKKNTTIM